jgi:hypothetical protein
MITDVDVHVVENLAQSDLDKRRFAPRSPTPPDARRKAYGWTFAHQVPAPRMRSRAPSRPRTGTVQPRSVARPTVCRARSWSWPSLCLQHRQPRCRSSRPAVHAGAAAHGIDPKHRSSNFVQYSAASGDAPLRLLEERSRSRGSHGLLLCALDQEPQHERHLTGEGGESDVNDRILVTR